MSESQINSLGTKIQFYRMQRNITQAQLANLVGIEASYVGKIESHKIAPRMDTLQNIADILKVNIDQLVDGQLDIYNRPKDETELDHKVLNAFYSLPIEKKEFILRIVDKLESYHAQTNILPKVQSELVQDSSYIKEIISDLQLLDVDGQLLVNNFLKDLLKYLKIVEERNHG